MSSITPNLRKAAVFIRSLDADTAATLLSQLSPEEAQQVRTAIRELGALDPAEQADVTGEFRRSQRATNHSASRGVELELSVAAAADSASTPSSELPGGRKRFAGRRSIAQAVARQRPIDIRLAGLGVGGLCMSEEDQPDHGATLGRRPLERQLFGQGQAAGLVEVVDVLAERDHARPVGPGGNIGGVNVDRLGNVHV